MAQKLGTYDVVASLIPGLAFLWGVAWLGKYFGFTPIIPISGSLGDTSVLLALAYITGLFVQGIAQGVTERAVLALSNGFPSSRWLLDDDKYFSPEHRAKLKGAIAASFDTPVEPLIPRGTSKSESGKLKHRRYQELFYLCYNLVDQKKLSDRPLTFNAQYGLFRGAFTMALLTFVVFALVLFLKSSEVVRKGDLALWVWILVFLAGGSIVAFARMKKRGEDFAKSVYDLFYSYYCDQRARK